MVALSGFGLRATTDALTQHNLLKNSITSHYACQRGRAVQRPALSQRWLKHRREPVIKIAIKTSLRERRGQSGTWLNYTDCDESPVSSSQRLSNMKVLSWHWWFNEEPVTWNLFIARKSVRKRFFKLSKCCSHKEKTVLWMVLWGTKNGSSM